MAQSDKLQYTDVLDKDFFKNPKESADELNASLIEMAKGFKLVQKEASNFLKVNKDPKTADDLKKVNETIDKSVKSRKALLVIEKQLQVANKDNESLQKRILALEKAQEEQKKKNAKATKEQSDQEKAIANQRRKDSADRVKQIQLQTIAEDKERGALERLTAQIALNRMAVAKLKETDANYEQELKRLNSEIDRQVALQKSMVDAQSKARASVGNYTESVREAIDSSELYSESLNKINESNSILITGFAKMSAQLSNVKESLQSAEKSGQKLKLTLKSLGIGIIITAIASLGAFFKSSGNGARSLELIMVRIGATLSAIIGRLAKLGDSITGLGNSVKLFFSGQFKEAGESASKSINQMSTAFDGMGKSIEDSVNAQVALTKAIQEYELQLRKLQLTQLKFNLDEEDYNEISEDTTRNLNERNKALSNAIKARLESAKIGDSIAKKELEFSKQAVINSLIENNTTNEQIELAKKLSAEELITNDIILSANPELIKALEDRVKTAIDAEDKLSDLPRQEAKRLRQRLQAETLFDIELTRSKKLSANSQVAILTKQLADEKIQLEERQLIREQLNRAENEVFQNQFDLFNKGIDEENKLNAGAEIALKRRIDFNELVNERDAVALAKKIKRLTETNVTEEQGIEIAKIVKNIQDQRIQNEEAIAKLEEERINRLIKIQKLESEIFEINKQSELDSVIDLEQQKLDTLNEYNDKVLQSENVFNRKLIEEREKAFQQTQILLEKEYDLRASQLIRKSELEKTDIDNTESDEFLKAKKKEKVQAQLDADLLKLKNETNKKTAESEKANAELTQAIEIKKTQLIVAEIQKVTQSIESELNNRNELNNDSLQKEIDKNKENIDRQRQLAERGAENTLAFEESQLAKRELKQKKALEKQAREKEALQLTEAYFNALNARLTEVGGNPDTAPVRALGDVFLAKGLSKAFTSLAGFYEGTERVEHDLQGNKVHGGVDGYFLKVHGTERIMNGAQNNKVGDIDNDTLADIAYNYRLGNLMPIEQIREASESISKGSAHNIYDSILVQQNAKIVSTLEEIANKPSSQITLNEFNEIQEKIYKRREVITKTLKFRRL